MKINKKELRKEYINKRKTMNPSDYNGFCRAIYEKVITNQAYINSRYVYLYSSINNEADTSEIFKHALDNNKIPAFPKVYGKEMIFYTVRNTDSLCPGYMGIPEPCESEPADGQSGVIIVPGVLFDKKCSRMGYGGGFYDRYLEKHKNLTKIGIAFSLQICEEILTDKHDIPMDYVITENKIYRRNAE